MKKLLLLFIGVIAGLILLTNLGPLVGFAVSLAILYYLFKEFLKTDNVWMRIGLIIVGMFVLSWAVANVPAIFAVVAAYVLWLVYKKWNENDRFDHDDNDPFQNFEKQWSDLNKNKF